jgi:hypothetical protein
MLAVFAAGPTLTAQQVAPQASPPAVTSASLTLNDSLSLMSDGKGPYVNGMSGVKAIVDTRSGDFTLSFAPGSPRAFSFSLTKPADSTVAPRRGVVICNASKKSEILVHDLMSIPVGGTALRRGHIQLEIEFVDGKASKGYDESFNEHVNDPVPWFAVTRVSDVRWVVENPKIADGDVSSLRWFSLPAEYPNGAAWTLLGRAHFHTPLRMTISIAP